MKIDDNLQLGEDGHIVCGHCNSQLGSKDDPLAYAMRRESPSQAAGPGVRAPAKLFTDRPIGLRQTFCPSCYVLLATEVVPVDETSHRHWTLNA